MHFLRPPCAELKKYLEKHIDSAPISVSNISELRVRDAIFRYVDNGEDRAYWEITFPLILVSPYDRFQHRRPKVRTERHSCDARNNNLPHPGALEAFVRFLSWYLARAA